MPYEQPMLSVICVPPPSSHLQLVQMDTRGFSKLKRHRCNQQLTAYKLLVAQEEAADKLHRCCSSSYTRMVRHPAGSDLCVSTP